jgi:uncharacterized protein involved in exopolysaccharide biosynthesis
MRASADCKSSTVSTTGRIEELRAEVDYYHDRVALLRAKLYRWGEGSNPRLRRLEADLEGARQRLRDELARQQQ